MSGRVLRCFSLTPRSGYGDAASQYVYGMHQLGAEIFWSPFSRHPYERGLASKTAALCQSEIRDDLIALSKPRKDYDTVLLNLQPSKTYDDIFAREKGRRLFAYVTYELEVLPRSWRRALNGMKGIFVPTGFNRRAFIDEGITAPIHVAPHATREFAKGPAPEWLDKMGGRYVFYTIGTWTTRKALEQTIRTFLDEFSNSDPVAFVIKTDPLNYIRCAQHPMARARTKTERMKLHSWYCLAEILADYDSPPPIHLIAEQVPAEEIDALHASADCFISLTHGEGWGLCSFDALQCGNPVIMPGYGGQLDYLGEDYPFLVKHSMRSVMDKDWDYYFEDTRHGSWAEADASHARALMRRVFEDPARARALIRPVSDRINQTFRAEPICRKMAEIMDLI